MSWRVWGERLETSDLTGTRVAQSVVFNKNKVLRGCRLWVIVYNDPPFTDLNVKIYSNDSDSPGKLLATSTDSKTKAELITLDNGVKEFDLTFNDVPMQKNTKYFFTINGTGYTGSTSAHLAWLRGWPNPVYRPAGFGFEDLAIAPYAIYFIGADL